LPVPWFTLPAFPIQQTTDEAEGVWGAGFRRITRANEGRNQEGLKGAKAEVKALGHKLDRVLKSVLAAKS